MYLRGDKRGDEGDDRRRGRLARVQPEGHHHREEGGEVPEVLMILDMFNIFFDVLYAVCGMIDGFSAGRAKTAL